MSEGKGKSVVVAGLYSLCHTPKIDGIEPGGDWEGAELWNLNDWPHTLAARYHRLSRIYNLHNNLRQTVKNLHGQIDFDKYIGNDYRMLAEYYGTQIWLTEPCDAFPSATVYPYEKIKAFMGVGDWFFSSSIVYMLAHALYDGFDRIALRCVSMNNDDEYHWQALGVLYCVHLAERKFGIRIDAPERVMWEERFRPGDLAMLEESGGYSNQPYHELTTAQREKALRESTTGLYRIDKPYHTMDRYEQEQQANAAMAARKRTQLQ